MFGKNLEKVLEVKRVEAFSTGKKAPQILGHNCPKSMIKQKKIEEIIQKVFVSGIFIKNKKLKIFELKPFKVASKLILPSNSSSTSKLPKTAPNVSQKGLKNIKKFE